MKATHLVVLLLTTGTLGLSGCISYDDAWAFANGGCTHTSGSAQTSTESDSDHHHAHTHGDGSYHYEYEYEYEYESNGESHSYEYEYEYEYESHGSHDHDDADSHHHGDDHSERRVEAHGTTCSSASDDEAAEDDEELRPYDEEDTHEDENSSSADEHDHGDHAHHDQATDEKTTRVFAGRATAPGSFTHTIDVPDGTEELRISADWMRAGTVCIYVLNPDGEQAADDSGTGLHTMDNDGWVVVSDPMPGTWTLNFDVYGYVEYHVEATY